MINVIRFISISVLSFSEIFVISRFYKTKVNFKSIWLYISIILLNILGLLNYFFVNAFVRMISITILLGICNWLIFKKRVGETVISTIFVEFFINFADVIGAISLMIVFGKDANFIKSDFFDTFFANILVSTLFILICSIPLVNKLYSKIIKMTEKIKNKSLITISLLILISVNFLMAQVYYNMKSKYVIIINSILLLIYSYIIYKSISEKNNSIVIKAENDLLMKNLNEYENMVDRQRIDNHENKNQLLIIKNMIKKKDKNVIKYIDTIVKDEKEDDEALYTKVKNIPSGGLQGIIYQKMLIMKDNKILFSLDVGRDVRKIDLDKLSMDDNYKLCKIMGVLLDNAIEESIKIEDKRIMICLFVENEMLNIEISNNYNGTIDINQIDEKGFTTKGSGHGYGLSLVKQIVSETDIFESERKITDKVFKHIIRIKID